MEVERLRGWTLDVEGVEMEEVEVEVEVYFEVKGVEVGG